MQREGPAKKNHEKKDCIFYLQGRCRFGDKCHYSHEGYCEAFMIRHAESEFNKMANVFPDQQFFQETAKLKLHLNHAYIDCNLSEQGQAQCLKTGLPADFVGRNRELDIIFVSPLNRTLQTADLLIRSNKLSVRRVIVLPELTEVLSKICDFSEEMGSKKHKYQHFDFSQMKRFIQQSDFIQDEDNWQDALVDHDHFHKITAKDKNAYRYLMILQHIFPTPLESSERCFNRALEALEIMKDIVRQEKAEKVLVVSHNRILKYLDGRFSKGRARSFENCEIRSLIF